MFIYEIIQTWILIKISILFVMGTTIMFSSLGYTISTLWIWKKSFFSTIFLIIKVHPSNEINLDANNNLHSFCYWHCNHVLHIRIHDIDFLDFQEKLFFLSFSLQLMFIHNIRQTWMLIRASILLVMETIILFSSLGSTTLMLWNHFPYNRSSSMK